MLFECERTSKIITVHGPKTTNDVLVRQLYILGRRQVVRHMVLVHAFAGSIPAVPAKLENTPRSRPKGWLFDSSLSSSMEVEIGRAVLDIFRKKPVLSQSAPYNA